MQDFLNYFCFFLRLVLASCHNDVIGVIWLLVMVQARSPSLFLFDYMNRLFLVKVPQQADLYFWVALLDPHDVEKVSLRLL